MLTTEINLELEKKQHLKDLKAVVQTFKYLIYLLKKNGRGFTIGYFYGTSLYIYNL